MTKACEGYTNTLAFVDLAPVILFGVAFWFLSTVLRAPEPIVRRAVNLAAVLLVGGALIAGPTRKFFMAAETGASCNNLQWLQLPFFTAMALAFALLAWATLCVLREEVQPLRWWLVAVAAIWVGYLAVGDDVILLAGGGLLAVTWAGLLARLALRSGTTAAALLFVLYAVGTLVLPVLASSENRSASSTQWIEQGANAFNMAVLALGSFLLQRAYRQAGDRPVLVEN